MQLFEYNIKEILDKSDEEIPQANGKSSINRHDSKKVLDYSVQYIPRSYIDTGVFEFRITGIRKKVYAIVNGERKKRIDKKRIGTRAFYTIKIKPKKHVKSYEELLNENVDVFCSCNDFKYVFLDAAYKNYSGLNDFIHKWGLVPITYYAPIPHERAIERNPEARGAACKHILYLGEILLNYELTNLDDLMNDIKNKQIKSPYAYSDGMPRGRQKIEKQRKKIVNTILSLTLDDIKTDLHLDNLTVDIIDKVEKNARQRLWNYDSYYIAKAQKEIDNGAQLPDKYYLLPDDWMESYEELKRHFQKLKDEVEYYNKFIAQEEPEKPEITQKDVDDFFSRDDDYVDNLLKTDDKTDLWDVDNYLDDLLS